MRTLSYHLKYISAFILLIACFSCEEDDANLPQVESNFTFTVNIDTGTVTFINTSENANTYVWTFGDGTTSTEINPIKTFPNGTFTVTLEASNVAGGSNTFEDEITILIPEVGTIPISFDGQNTTYDVSTFGGAAFELVANPDPSGTNAEVSQVGAITNIGAAFEGFFINLGAPLDLSEQQSLTINFWSTTPVDVLIKLEEGTAADTEISASHTGSGWEILPFTFSSNASFDRLTVFVDGPGTTSGTFYIDDIVQTTIEVEAMCTDDMPQSLLNTNFNLTFSEDPSAIITADGAALTVIDNPDFENNINTSCRVGQIVRDASLPFANTQFVLDNKLNFTENTGFSLKVWSPNAGTNVLLKLEDKTQGNTGPSVEVSAVTTTASAWEELTFNFDASQTDTYDRIILFFELAQNVAETYFIDDLKLVAGMQGNSGGGEPTGENLLTNGDFEAGTQAWFGNALDVRTEGGNSFNFANVASAGNAFDVNLSQVVSITQGQTYTLTFDASSDGNRTILAGIGLNESPFTNNSQTVNLTSTSQTFTLELSADGFGIPNSRVLFDLGADTGVVVIDNVSLVLNESDTNGGNGNTGGSGANLVTNPGFEMAPLVDNGWLIFANNGTVERSTTQQNGGANSARLLASGSGGIGRAPVLKQEGLGINAVTGGATVTVSFDIRADVTQPGAVINVALFSEKTEGATRHDITIPETNNTWQTVTTDIVTDAALDPSRGLSIEFQAACGAVEGCNIDMFIDNVSISVNNTP